MSLEDQFEKLNANVEKLIETIKESDQLRQSAVEAARATVDKANASTKKTEPAKTEAKADAKTETKADSGSGKSVPSVADVEAVMKTYIDGSEPKTPERKARVEKLGEVMNHPKVRGDLDKVGTTKDIPEKARSTVITTVKGLIEKGNLIKEEEPDAEEGDSENLFG